MLIAHSNPINLCSFAWPFVASHRVASRPMYIKPVPKWTWERVASESIKSNTRTILSHAHCATAGYIHLRLHKPRRARTHVKRELSRKESCERERDHNWSCALKSCAPTRQSFSQSQRCVCVSVCEKLRDSHDDPPRISERSIDWAIIDRGSWFPLSLSVDLI